MRVPRFFVGDFFFLPDWETCSRLARWEPCPTGSEMLRDPAGTNFPCAVHTERQGKPAP